MLGIWHIGRIELHTRQGFFFYHVHYWTKTHFIIIFDPNETKQKSQCQLFLFISVLNAIISCSNAPPLPLYVFNPSDDMCTMYVHTS